MASRLLSIAWGAWLVLLALGLPVADASAQLGDDTGPGARRIPVSRLPYTIDRPGSYFLTATLVGDRGITIASADVTLDLDGHTLVGLEAAGDAIEVDVERDNIVIQNGSMRDWGGHGVNALRAFHSQIKNVRATSNGGHGLLLGRESAITECASRFNGGSGVSVSEGTTVSDTVCVFNGGSGIAVHGACRVLRNTCQNNGYLLGIGAGVLVTGDDNRIQGNDLSDNDVGLDIRGRDNLVAENLVRHNVDNYEIERGNVLHILLGQIPEVIEWPATVTLAAPLTGKGGDHGVEIRSDDVSIDLNGHALIGFQGSYNGIIVRPGYANISVHNGSLREWDGHGIFAADAGGNVEVRDVMFSSNGLYGAWLGDESTSLDCRAVRNGRRAAAAEEREALEGGGLRLGQGGTLRDCTAIGNEGTGFAVGPGSTFTDCLARNNAGSGLSAADGCQVIECTASFNGVHGFEIASQCTLRGSSANDNVQDGIRIGDECRMQSNTASGNGDGEEGAGLHVIGSRNRVEDNSVSGNARGLVVDGTRNLVVRNSAAGNESDFEIVPGNSVGRIVEVQDGTVPGGDPWANFVH